jgi:hypothetical protein
VAIGSASVAWVGVAAFPVLIGVGTSEHCRWKFVCAESTLHTNAHLKLLHIIATSRFCNYTTL